MDKSLNRSIFKLAIPSTFTALVEPIISFTDKSVASSYDNDFISAISMNAVLLALLVWGCGSIRGVILNKTANLLGKNSLQKKSTEIGAIMLTGLLITISLTLVAFLLFSFYLQLYDYSTELKETATSYLHIRLLGVPLLIYMMFNSAFLRGKQNVTTPLLIALLVAVLNVIGDFTFPLFMSPLEGIAWASVFAQFIGVCIYFVVTRKDIHFSFSASDLFNSDVLKSFSQSFLLFQRTILLHAVLFFYQWQISKYDIQYANEFNLLLETWLFTAFFLDGYGMAVASLGGLYQGQNNIEKLHLAFKRSSLWAAVTGVGLAVIIWIGQPLI